MTTIPTETIVTHPAWRYTTHGCPDYIEAVIVDGGLMEITAVREDCPTCGGAGFGLAVGDIIPIPDDVHWDEEEGGYIMSAPIVHNWPAAIIRRA